MAKFCKKCGARLNELNGLCPNCDKAEVVEKAEEINSVSDKLPEQQKQLSKKELKTEKKRLKKQSKKDKKKQKRAQLTTKQKVKRFFVKLIAGVLALTIAAGGCVCALVYFDVLDIPAVSKILEHFTENTSHAKYAKQIVKAFKNNDIQSINDIVFRDDTLKIDDNIGVTIDSPETNNNDKSVLEPIFSHTKISYKGIEDNKFVYDIDAPNMREVFSFATNIQTQDELIKHIENYAQNAKNIGFTVSVDYVENDGELIADYQTEEFINAITGGLVDAYKDIYSQYINELVSSGGVN